jgi:two-component system response regulator DesR
VKVLIADDSEVILGTLQEMLGRFGQVEIVASCHNGTEALKAMLALKPDLAIVDLKMPGLTGLEVLTQIRKEKQTIRFIILTFYSSSYYRQQAIKAGADYFFSKEDDFGKITDVVEEMLKKEESDRRNNTQTIIIKHNIFYTTI